MPDTNQSTNEMEQFRLKAEDFANNTATRISVCIVIDTSYSMIGEKLNAVNEGISRFIKECMANPFARNAVDLNIIACGNSEPEEVQPFANVKDVKFIPLKAGINTPLGASVELALDNITAQRRRYGEYGISSYKPWLIIMSDGRSTDNVDEAAAEVKELVGSNRLRVCCINMNTSDKASAEDLIKFSPDGEAGTIDAMTIKDFFSDLSRSATEVSTQAGFINDDNFELMKDKNGKV